MQRMNKATVDACYLYKTFIDFCVRAEMSKEATDILIDMFYDIEVEAEAQTHSSDATNIDVAYNKFIASVMIYLNEISSGEKTLVPKIRSVKTKKDPK